MAPGATITDAGSPVVTGRSPTITEQQDSTSEKRDGVRVGRAGPLDELGQGHRAGDLEGVGVGAGGGAGRRPVAQGHLSAAGLTIGG